MASDANLQTALDAARHDLLDLSARNRLLNTSRSRSRSSRLEIVGRRSADVFQQLVQQRKALTFAATATADVESDDQPAEATAALDDTLPAGAPAATETDAPETDAAEQAIAHSFADNELPTTLSADALQKRLLKLYYDARTYEEEQGVNILYLALGFLKWHEADNSAVERYAPLLLVPVHLERQSARARFRLRYSEDEISTNLSLQARLKNDFSVVLPDVPDDEELNPDDYFQSVAEAVRGYPRWQVLADDQVLWFFSFSKFLMYRDLEPDNWPAEHALLERGLLPSLLGGGFQNDPPLCDEDGNIDELIRPRDMVHVLDADSSQSIVIEEAKRGRNLVIQGPPGTGKSQTIANLVCGAVEAGKTVLFVAEKMAALDVVHRRLHNLGLGDMCLELHSNKANKRAVLEQLAATLLLGPPAVDDVDRLCTQLDVCRDRLNAHLRLIHGRLEPNGLTPYQIVGQLVRLRAAGTPPPDFELADAPTWRHADVQSRLNSLADLAHRVHKFDSPATHPWRGVGLEAILPSDADRLQARLPDVASRVERLLAAAADLAAALDLPPAVTPRAIAAQAQLARQLTTAPPLDRRSLADSAWTDRRTHIDKLVTMGQQWTAARRQLDGVVADVAWQTDVAAVRRDLAAYGTSWFRWLYPLYRAAQHTLRGILVGPPPKPLERRIALLDTLISGQQAHTYLASEAAQQLGRRAFGDAWHGIDSDWPRLAAIAEWERCCQQASLPDDFRQVAARLESTAHLPPRIEAVAAELKPTLAELQPLFQQLALSLETAFGAADLHEVDLSEVVARLRQWRDQPEGLSIWISYFSHSQRLAREGFGPVISRLDTGQIGAADVVSRCEMAYYEALIRHAWQAHPELATFHGATHEQQLQTFRELDLARLKLAKQQVALAHYQKIPRGSSTVGEMGLVNREIAKKRRHLPIRQLLAKAGRAVQAIKPVFMMSPISVAQYLEPGALEFDMLVIDEASQVQPVDALGAAARARQIIVVGDSKQLPPTRFFSRLLGESDAGDDEELDLNAGDMESILSLCCAQSVPQRMLRWHYRSRHHSLIAVSNQQFYENRLFVVPSPGQPAPDQGLSVEFVAEGVFDRGGSATNRAEARAVAQAVMQQARQRPHQTLGVGCFSVAQRDAILDELELLRRDDTSLEAFFMNPEEPFFVKNLENIQGDERDAIFISVGYGKDANGCLAMNFGPLSNDGGERRLNVLITRARDCCRVFTSIRSDDIDLNRGRSRGAHCLKAFLKYAETGLLDTGAPTGRDYDSEFERQVAQAIAGLGYQTEPQVGVAGFFIDLAVIDPEQPGRYLLGIECDGANYHRSRSARDRDRLRGAVLESRGWMIHRVWSTDWFQRPDQELRKVLAAIEAAQSAAAQRNAGTARPRAPATPGEAAITRRAADDAEEGQCGGVPIEPYVIASFRIPAKEVPDLPTADLARVVARIVDIEGPIHEQELFRRVTQLFKVRSGSRIREAIERAMQLVERSGGVERDGPFIDRRFRPAVPIRDRGEVDVASLRRPEMLPPAELRQAVSAIIQIYVGITLDDLASEAARLLGFKTTSRPLREVIEREVAAMQSAGLVEQRQGHLYLLSRQTT